MEFSHDTTDDIIFYIRCGDRSPLLTVARRESVCPVPELEMDWRATFYANLVLHTLEFTMVCAVGCTDARNMFK